MPRRQGGGRARRRPVRPDDARRPAPARRLRRRHRGGGGPAARQPARLRRPVVRLLRRAGGATCAGCRAGSRARRPTSTAAAASCSRCRRASSTSAARRRRTTSAPRRRSTRSRAIIYLSWLGRAGIVELGELMLQRTAYARARAGRARRASSRCTSSPSCASSPCGSTPTSTRVIERCAPRASTPATRSARDYPEHEDGLLVAITEQRIAGRHRPAGRACSAEPSPHERRARRRPEQRRRHEPTRRRDGTPMQRDRATTIFEKSHAGPARVRARPRSTCRRPPTTLLPERFRRREPPRLPEIAEPEIIRHYNRLSKRNFDLDTGFYPLGSCTMKHNPKLHERVAALPGNARLHPAQAPARAQGALQLMYELQGALGEIAGLPHVSLQPSAGSHGELAGVLLTRAFHEANGDQRHKVLTPDTAHGTNPATVTMAGYEVVKIGTDDQGGVDIDDLKANLDDDVACLMLTNPNTLGRLRHEHRGDLAARARGGGDPLLRRREPQRGHGPDAAGRHGLRHRPLQPPQDLHAAPRRRRPGRGPDRGLRPDRAVPAEARRSSRQEGRRLRPRLRPPEVDRPPARVPGQLRRLRALLRLHPLARRRRPAGGVGDRGAQRELPAGAAQGGRRRRAPAGRLRSPVHARVRALAARR